MKRTLTIVLLLVLGTVMAAQTHSFRGTVTRMKMSECSWQPGFRAAMSGMQGEVSRPCPEYTIVSDKVVYVLVAKRVDQFVPLAEDLVFHVKKNEVILFADDEKGESKFVVRQMILRGEWEREEARRVIQEKLEDRSVDFEVREPSRAALLQPSLR